MNKYYSVQFGQVYGGGAYSACAYQDTTACGTSTGGGTGTTTPAGGANGGLVNTGFIVLVIATIACLLICAAMIVKFWRRPRKLATQQINVEHDDQYRR